ncbi:MAG: GntR family transcriptional regulator, partial [Lentisphaeria bacterium]|nr:GntR family transcriptional regulator [Lentisphaeria bacterium]
MKQSDNIYQQLLGELEKGMYPVGTRFPSEFDLADRFNVSKDTINRAVSRLVERGLLRRG